jgi:hypothetical protein
MRWKSLVLALAQMAQAGTGLAATAPAVTCIENDDFVVMSREGPDVGSDIIARKKPNPRAKASCVFKVQPSDYKIAKAGEAKYVKALQGNMLVLDQGTGPSPRGLSVVDLLRRKKVWSGEYYNEEEDAKTGPQGVTFWRYLGPGKEPQCEDYKKIVAQSFTPLMVIKGTLSFPGLQFKPQGAAKCVIGQ